MLVSALLTSVVINFGLCVLCWTLYSILSERPDNYPVYAPRLPPEGRSPSSTSRRSRLETLLRIPVWVGHSYRSSDNELLSSAGLDAVVFRRLIAFSLKVTTVAGVIGIFILLPVNFSGDQLQDLDFAHLTNNSLDIFTISNVRNGSKRLWVHFAAVYFLTIFICYHLYVDFEYVSSQRISFFKSSKPQPSHFTILVRSVPVSPRSSASDSVSSVSDSVSSVSDSVETFFRKHHPSTYLSHVVIRRTGKVRRLISDAKKLYKRFSELQKEQTAAKSQIGGSSGLFRRKGDTLNDYGKRLEDLEENVRLGQSVASSAGEEVRAAFVSFKSRYGAAVALRMQQSDNPIQMVTEEAPEPHDVYWPLFSECFILRWISQLVVLVTYVLLTVLFLIPVVLVQGLTNLSQLEAWTAWLPYVRSILETEFVSQVITGYLPNLILLLFLLIVPDIMKFLSSVQGYISNSEIIRSACNKFLWFMIWNVFWANVLSGSVINQLFFLLNPTNVPSRLAHVVPAQASFFIAYVVTSGWTSTSIELFQPGPLFCRIIRRPFQHTDAEVKARTFCFHAVVPSVLFFGFLGITYFFLAPLILPFLLVYFCLGYIIYTNQFITVYSPQYETAGKFWPIVHNSMIFSLLLMHAIALGIFTLKKLPLASTFIFPLPILTLIFNSYCRKRFLPNFMAYSAEVLIYKDSGDLSTTADFLDHLITAYQDPALLPVRYSSDPDGKTAPLLTYIGD